MLAFALFGYRRRTRPIRRGVYRHYADVLGSFPVFGPLERGLRRQCRRSDARWAVCLVENHGNNSSKQTLMRPLLDKAWPSTNSYAKTLVRNFGPKDTDRAPGSYHCEPIVADISQLPITPPIRDGRTPNIMRLLGRPGRDPRMEETEKLRRGMIGLRHVASDAIHGFVSLTN